MRKERVVVISPQKSGTHLICELMAGLDYRTIGWIVRDEKAEFTSEELTALAETVLPRHKRGMFCLARRLGLWKARETSAIRLVLDLWGARLGAPWTSRKGIQILHRLYSIPNLPRLSGLDMSSLPTNLCIVKHELPLDTTDGLFIRQWATTGEPALIFMHRDPRDVLCSFVRYLSGRTRNGKHGGFAEYFAYQPIMDSLPNDDERLMHAIIDPSFPGHKDYFECLWLLRHPNVCKVSYEELVGNAGDGSHEVQIKAVSRVLRHLGINGDPAQFARNIYRTDSFTFSRGKIGSWKKMFKSEHHEAFNARYGRILEWYGYKPFVP